MSEPAAAVVVAGGTSRRLGRDKRFLRLRSGRTLLAETVARVSEVAREIVVVVSTDPAAFADLPARVVRDARPGDGPLNALEAGLSAIAADRAIVVACDLPCLSVPLLRGLLEQSGDADLLVPRRADGTLEMLHAVYRTTCLPAIRQRLRDDRLKLSELVADLRVHYLGDAELAPFDPGLRSFLNVNTPEDLARVEDLV